MYLLIASYYLLFAILAWKRLNWAVLLVIALLPTYLIRFQIGFVPMTLLEGMVLITFITWVIKKFPISNFQFPIKFQMSKSKTLVIGNWELEIQLLLFLVSATVAMFVAPDLRAAAGIWKAYFIEPILFFIIINDLIRNPSQPPLNLRGGATDVPPLKVRGGRGSYEFNISPIQIIFTLSITALALSIYAIYQRFTGFGIPPPWNTELRVTSIFPYPNALGLFLAPLIPLFVMRLFSTRKLIVNSYWLMVIIASILAIIFAKSTGAMVGVVAGLLAMTTFYFLQVQRIKRNESGIMNQELGIEIKIKTIIHNSYFIIPLVLLLALAIGTVSKNTSLRNELLLKDWSGHVRRTQWTETINMLKDRPILGAGLAGYKQTLVPYHKAAYLEIFEYPHNIILNFWSETGLLGLMAFLWLIVFFFKQIQKQWSMVNSQWLIVGAGTAMITLLVHGTVDVPYFKNDLAILFWIIFALALTNTQKNNIVVNDN